MMVINIRNIDKVAILHVLYSYAALTTFNGCLSVKPGDTPDTIRHTLQQQGLMSSTQQQLEEMKRLMLAQPTREEVKELFRYWCCGLFPPNLNFHTIEIGNCGQKKLQLDLSTDQLDITPYCHAQQFDETEVAGWIEQIRANKTNYLLAQIRREAEQMFNAGMRVGEQVHNSLHPHSS